MSIQRKMNAEQTSNRLGTSTSEPIAARTRRRLQLEARSEARAESIIELMTLQQLQATIDNPSARRTPAHIPNGSYSETQNNVSTTILSNELINEASGPIATRTRARTGHTHIRQNRVTNTLGNRREMEREESSNAEENRSLHLEFFVRSTNHNGQRVLLEYIDAARTGLRFYPENTISSSERSFQSTDDSTDNSTSTSSTSDSTPSEMPVLDLSTAEISDPLNAFKCAICLDLYLKKVPVVTKCGHIYCMQCIIDWLYIGITCPKCNRIVDAASLMRVFP